jgi:two-component system chemotaxis response regulator CheB
VDDSATVRAVLRRRLEAEAQLHVVGYASDGIEALERIEELDPDVITLDIEMPRLDGLGTLERIMRDHPTPVVMVSTLTSEGAEATLRALELGAVDFIEKPAIRDLRESEKVVSLGEKVLHAARARVRTARPIKPVRHAPPSAAMLAAASGGWDGRLVVIGSSTGGPQALREVLTSLPIDLGVPVAVVQHMPEGFTATLAERLDDLAPLHVLEGAEGLALQPGMVVIAPGGRHMTISRRGRIALNDRPTEHGVRPAVNVTMESVAEWSGSQLTAAVLTGMGSDGTRGVGLLKERGAHVIAEDESTCIVYGMPKSVVDAGLADATLPLDRIAGAIAAQCRTIAARSA